MQRTFSDFEKEARQYSSIIQNFSKNGTQFIDHSFHPTKNLFEKNVTFNENDTVWERIDKYFKFPLFDPKLIHPNYIQQGELGDCYFISALTRISTQPNLVKQLFDTETPKQILGDLSNSINLQSGAVVIYLYAFGRKTPVLIDTLIPFKRGTRQPRFAHPSNIIYSAWMCLVEKAYAKLQGSYSSIIGGSFIQAMYNIYGFYPKEIEIKTLKEQNKGKTFDKLLEFYNNEFAMDASITTGNLPKSISVKSIEDLGLCTSHSYLIQKVQRAKNLELVCLRNPWGDHEWLGDWSDTSDLWTEELRNVFESHISNDGTFWMCWNDFSKYFTTIHISKPISNNLNIKSYEVEMKPGKYDGIAPSSIPRLSSKERNAYIFQLLDKIQPNNKCLIQILVEKRSIFFDEKKRIVYQQNNTGLVIREETNSSINFKTICANRDVFSFEYQVDDNFSGLEISIHRLKAMPIVEHCYVKIMCNYNFKLFNANRQNECLPNVQIDRIFVDRSIPKQSSKATNNVVSKPPTPTSTPQKSGQKPTQNTANQKIDTKTVPKHTTPVAKQKTLNPTSSSTEPIVRSKSSASTPKQPTPRKQPTTTKHPVATDKGNSKQTTPDAKSTPTKQNNSSNAKSATSQTQQASKPTSARPKSSVFPQKQSTPTNKPPVPKPPTAASKTLPVKPKATPQILPSQKQNATGNATLTASPRNAPARPNTNQRASTSLIQKSTRSNPQTAKQNATPSDSKPGMIEIQSRYSSKNQPPPQQTTEVRKTFRQVKTISPSDVQGIFDFFSNLPEGSGMISEQSSTVETQTTHNNVVITEKRTQYVTIGYKKTVW